MAKNLAREYTVKKKGLVAPPFPKGQVVSDRGRKFVRGARIPVGTVLVLVENEAACFAAGDLAANDTGRKKGAGEEG